MMSHGYIGTPMVQRLTTTLQNIKPDVLLNTLIALSIHILKWDSNLFQEYLIYTGQSIW